MTKSCVWKGKLPQYWSTSNWAMLIEELVLLIYRRSDDNRRVLVTRSASSGELHKTAFTQSNTILASRDNLLVLARADDARIHTRIHNIHAIDIVGNNKVWSMSSELFTEKNSMPFLQSSNILWCGTSLIDISTGNVKVGNKFNALQWPISNDETLSQEGSAILCMNKKDVLWVVPELKGHWYQGRMDNHLVFFDPHDTLMLIDSLSGEKHDEIKLLNCRKHIRKIGGKLTYPNHLTYHFTSIYDVLMNNENIYWIGNDDFLYSYSFKNHSMVKGQKLAQDSFLVGCNNNSVLALKINDQDLTGQLYTMEG